MAIPQKIKKSNGFRQQKPCCHNLLRFFGIKSLCLAALAQNKGIPTLLVVECCWWSFVSLLLLYCCSGYPAPHEPIIQAVRLLPCHFFFVGLWSYWMEDWFQGGSLLRKQKWLKYHPSFGVPHVFFFFFGGISHFPFGTWWTFRTGGRRFGPSRRIWTSCGERCVKFNGSDDDPVGFFLGLGLCSALTRKTRKKIRPGKTPETELIQII